MVEQEKYNPKYDKKYFEDLDKLVEKEMEEKEPKDRKIEFIPLTSDFMFKSVMKRNPLIFKDFLINTMDLDINNDDDIHYYLDSELIKDYRKEKGKRVDLRVIIGEGLLITVEVNRMKYDEVKDRNNLFFEKLDILQFEVGDKYRTFKYKKLYQLNLNANEDEKGVNKRKILDYDVINNEVVDDRRVKFVITLANYYNMYYNESKDMSLNEIFLAGLMSKNFVELYTIMSKVLSDRDLDDFMESVVNMCKELENIHEWQKEKMDAMVQNNIYESGIQQGIEDNTITTIKNMLLNNAEYDFISKVTGKSLNEIKEIEQSMKQE